MKDWQSIPTEMLAATPTGEMPITPAARRHLLPGASKGRSALTYGPYLDSVRRFLLCCSGAHLSEALSAHLGRSSSPKEIETILIRTEKHGAFYHVARVDVHLFDRSVSFVVNVAASDLAQLTLKREYRLLRSLARRFRHPYLPRVYCQGMIRHQGGSGEPRRLRMVVGEWFGDHHEFHPHRPEGEGRARLLLWDATGGYRLLTDAQTALLYRQAARILTDYYDWNSFCEIYPWHHAAGDFVVRAEGNKVEIRLITVRDYAPAVRFRSRKMAGKMLALILFFLHLTLQTRLDRIDGVGDLAWAEDEVISNTLAGFFDGLAGKGDAPSSSVLHGVLAAFEQDEWRQLLNEVLGIYTFSAEELELIHRHGDSHIKQLRLALQSVLRRRE